MENPQKETKEVLKSDIKVWARSFGVSDPSAIL